MILHSDYPHQAATVLQSIGDVQTDNFDIALVHLGQFVQVNKATIVVATLPLNANVAWPVGGSVELAQNGIGIISAPSGGGVTVSGITATAGVGQVLKLRKIGTDAWYGSL